MKKILLIDDDPTLVHLLSEFLKNESFEICSAQNGSDGLRLAYDQQPDLILLDVMLPRMDGWEVCARLREMSGVPIIMLTAKTTETDKLRGFRLGVDDYVTKPFSFAELVARIQAVLARSTTSSSNTLARFTGIWTAGTASTQDRAPAGFLSLTTILSAAGSCHRLLVSAAGWTRGGRF